MPLPDDIETFQSSLQSQPELMELLDAVSADAAFQESLNATRAIDPLSASLSLVAVAALWRLLKVGIDTLRHMSEDATLKRRVEIIGQLQQAGYQREAPLIVDRLLKEMRDRPADDPLLKKLIELYPD